MDLGGKELNHFNVVFFNVVRKAWHFTESKTLSRHILVLKKSRLSWGSVVPSYSFISVGCLKPCGNGTFIL